MRFMMLMIPGGYESAEPGAMPDPAHVEKMMAFNNAMQEAGILRGAEGLHPPSMGARVTFSDGKPIVTDGPFAETREVLGGFWLIEVASKAEAVAWAARCPGLDNETIEVRQVQEMEDFPEDVQRAAQGFDDMQTGKG